MRGKNFASLATLMPDGSPQVTPVWVDLEGEIIVINTSEDRLKTSNTARDPRVAISIFDNEDPYDYVAIRGRVTEMTKKGAEEHIDRLSLKYLGTKKYPWRRKGVSRILLKIEPLRSSR